MTKDCLKTTASYLAGNVAQPYWETLYRVAAELGIETEPFGHAEITVVNSITTVPVYYYLDVFERGLKQYSDFGLRVGRSITPGTYPVLGMTLLNCQNLAQVLEQVVRYESLSHDLGTSHLKHVADESIYCWLPKKFICCSDKSDLCFHLVLSVFAGIYTFAPWLVQRKIPVKQINFTCSAPANAQLYRQFFATNIAYDQPVNSIVVDSEILNWPVANPDASSFYALTSYATALLQEKEQNRDIVQQLQAILPEALSCQEFRIEEVAMRLHISGRTLQRKLKEAGYNYQTVLDSSRQKIAERYLLDTELSLAEIAFLIGYREQSSFNHAFRGWKGITPSQFREQSRD